MRGLTPDELASDTLQQGAEVYALTGKVKRPPAPTLPLALEEEARRLLAEMQPRRLALDTIQQVAALAG